MAILLNVDTIVTAFRELAIAIVDAGSSSEILCRLARVLRDRFGMVHGEVVLLHGAFWSAEAMLGFDIRQRNVLGKFDYPGLFPDDIAELVTVEIVSEREMADRFHEGVPASEESGGLSRLRIRLLHRQKFIGYFTFDRMADGDGGTLSRQIAALMGIFGAIVPDVAETRTNQRLERDSLLAQNRQLKSRLEPVSDSLIGESDAMREVYAQVRQVAGTDATVLIRGASGTGKELVARSIVDLSPRKGRPFLTVNCAALPETLIESELFGHEKGAFTGAVERRIGRAEAADGGTLFLDEIGDLTPATQVKLLRFLQERTFSRIGANAELRSNVRFIAATSRNLEELIEKKLFREDLYYRLNVFTIQMPALADRRGDILILARHFAEKFNVKYGKSVKRYSADATAALVDWKWPGNVRELENCIERAVLTATDDTVRVRNLPPAMRPAGWDHDEGDGAAAPTPTGDRTFAEMVAAYKRSIIDAAIERHGGNKSAAARSLGLTPRMMYYELKTL